MTFVWQSVIPYQFYELHGVIQIDDMISWTKFLGILVVICGEPLYVDTAVCQSICLLISTCSSFCDLHEFLKAQFQACAIWYSKTQSKVHSGETLIFHFKCRIATGTINCPNKAVHYPTPLLWIMQILCWSNCKMVRFCWGIVCCVSLNPMIKSR